MTPLGQLKKTSSKIMHYTLLHISKLINDIQNMKNAW